MFWSYIFIKVAGSWLYLALLMVFEEPEALPAISLKSSVLEGRPLRGAKDVVGRKTRKGSNENVFHKIN